MPQWGLFLIATLEKFDLHGSSIKTARRKEETTSSFCLFASVESFMVAKVCNRGIDRVVT